jgi:hypothetical protein
LTVETAQSREWTYRLHLVVSRQYMDVYWSIKDVFVGSIGTYTGI